LLLRMIIFVCPNCGQEQEELVETNENGNIQESILCTHCSVSMIKGNFLSQIHREGAKYRHVSWSTWNAN